MHVTGLLVIKHGPIHIHHELVNRRKVSNGIHSLLD